MRDFRRSLSMLLTFASATTLILVSGCMQNMSAMPADKAFALSASALSGSDRYGVQGVVSIVDPNGIVAGKSRYRGEVTGHGKMNLKWTENAPGVRARTAGASSAPGYQPLDLLGEVQHGKATVAYADRPYTDNSVSLLVKLNDGAAKHRIANGLRAELAGIRKGLKDQKLTPSQRIQAEAAISRADRQLEDALSTLRVRTVCLWTADRNTWFPRQMKEETELAYSWNGKTLKEKRVSETNFLRNGPNGRMGKKM